MNDIYTNLISKRDIIFDYFKNLNIPIEYIDKITPKAMVRLPCTEIPKNEEFVPNYDIVHIKNNTLRILNTTLLEGSQEIKSLFSDDRILNVYLFHVWGSVPNHLDPPSNFSYLNYNVDSFKSLLMPIKVPTHDPSHFASFLNEDYVDIQEGEILEWDVVNSEHYWIIEGIESNFVLLHIDYC